MAMSEQILYERLSELCATLKASRESEAKALDDFLAFLSQGLVLEYDTTKILWETVQGPKGPYERSSEDSLDFNILLKDLDRHDGRLTHEGWFYWRFNNSNTIGRKPRD
jgi:hypothetical protein